MEHVRVKGHKGSVMLNGNAELISHNLEPLGSVLIPLAFDFHTQ